MVQYLDPKGRGFVEVSESGRDYLSKLFQKEHLSNKEMEDSWILAKLESRETTGLYTHPEDLDKIEQPYPMDTRGSARRLFEAGHIEIVN